jgi:hypothetical protein
MTQILPSASYLRAAHVHADAQSVLHSLPEHDDLPTPEASRRVWDLLETPQTIETICRVLGREYDLPQHACQTEVQAFLSQLYREGLIEVSPDS